jgi:predicted site-specific integrase-resolvase
MPSTTTLPKYIPLSEAATQLNIEVAKLHAMATSGRIKAIQLPDGDLAVNEEVVDSPLRKEDLPEYKKFSHLANETTWVSKAARDYNIPLVTISQWANKNIIDVVGKKGNKKLLNAQDVAYCAYIYEEFQNEGETQGRRMFDDNGLPYKPKTGPHAE